MLVYPKDASQAIKLLAYQGEPISLVGCYKGMHFYEDISPVRVGSDHVVFRSPSVKLSLMLHSRVFIHNRLLPETIWAVPQVISGSPGEINLKEFAYTGTFWSDRREQRVQPEIPLQAELLMSGIKHPVTIQDISTQGLNVWLDPGIERNVEISINHPVRVSVFLKSEIPMNIQGRIVNRHNLGHGMLALGIYLTPDSTQEAWLALYIAERKKEILMELDELVCYRLGTYQIQEQFF